LKTAAIWGGVALVLCIVKPPLLVALLLAVLVGALNGVANLWLLRQMKPDGAGIPPAQVPLDFKTVTVMAETEWMQDRFYEHARALPSQVRTETYAIRDAKDEFDPYGLHRILSPPARVQGDMDDEMSRAARLFGLPPGTPWVMLLQLDSDKAVNWQWCDDGAIYFWIPAADLAGGRFDRVWVVLQSP
jgi:hypothetical protein